MTLAKVTEERNLLRRERDELQAEVKWLRKIEECFDNTPWDAFRAYLEHSDAIHAVRVGQYDAEQGIYDVHRIQQWLDTFEPKDDGAA